MKTTINGIEIFVADYIPPNTVAFVSKGKEAVYTLADTKLEGRAELKKPEMIIVTNIKKPRSLAQILKDIKANRKLLKNKSNGIEEL